MMKKILLSGLALSLSWTMATAAPPAPSEAMQQEVRHLLDYLERSGCAFYRNGAWHDSRNARQHLDKKFQYLLDKGLAKKTEDFIEKAASESSMSNKPYQVKCNDGKAVASARWLADELARYRKADSGKK